MAQKSGKSNKNWISYEFFKKKPCSSNWTSTSAAWLFLKEFITYSVFIGFAWFLCHCSFCFLPFHPRYRLRKCVAVKTFQLRKPPVHATRWRNQYTALRRIKFRFQQYQDHIFRSNTRWVKNSAAVFIFKKMCQIFIPPRVLLRLTWNWYCWIQNFKLFNWTLRLGKYDIINIVPKFQNGIFPRRSLSHAFYVIKMVPLDSPHFYESNSV